MTEEQIKFEETAMRILRMSTYGKGYQPKAITGEDALYCLQESYIDWEFDHEGKAGNPFVLNGESPQKYSWDDNKVVKRNIPSHDRYIVGSEVDLARLQEAFSRWHCKNGTNPYTIGKISPYCWVWKNGALVRLTNVFEFKQLKGNFYDNDKA